MTRGSERQNIVKPEEWNREDAHYLWLLKECNEKKNNLARLQDLKLGEAPWAYADAVRMAHEISILEYCRHSYVEHLIRIHV